MLKYPVMKHKYDKNPTDTATSATLNIGHVEYVLPKNVKSQNSTCTKSTTLHGTAEHTNI
jgi:hypothetical protein